MDLLFRLLRLVPAVQRLEDERDALRSEQNSIRLKLRAAAAEMGVLDEQCRVLRTERDKLTQDVVQHKADHESQAARLKAASVAGEALRRERDDLAQERRTLVAQVEAARSERDRMAKALESRRQKAGPG